MQYIEFGPNYKTQLSKGYLEFIAQMILCGLTWGMQWEQFNLWLHIAFYAIPLMKMAKFT